MTYIYGLIGAVFELSKKIWGQWRLARPEWPRSKYHLSYLMGIGQRAGVQHSQPHTIQSLNWGTILGRHRGKIKGLDGLKILRIFQYS